jgi:hypothetical protein
MEALDKKLVSRLTKLECDMQEMHLRGYDKHVGIAELNKHMRRSRKERIKEVVKEFVFYIVPYVVAMVLIFSIMSMRG